MTNKQERSTFGLVRLSKQNQNPKKFGPIPCIWKHHPKGVRAGNSPVWKGDTDQLGMGEDHEGEKQASKNITKITKQMKAKLKPGVEYGSGLYEGAWDRDED